MAQGDQRSIDEESKTQNPCRVNQRNGLRGMVKVNIVGVPSREWVLWSLGALSLKKSNVEINYLHLSFIDQ